MDNVGPLCILSFSSFELFLALFSHKFLQVMRCPGANPSDEELKELIGSLRAARHDRHK